MLTYQTGDIFTAQTQVIVNPVNCEGIMGKGLALTFKQRYPAMFLIYQHECAAGILRIGHPTLYQESTPWILNFPTKDKVRANSTPTYIEEGLQYVVANYAAADIKSIAFPKLGAGYGRLTWETVGPLMATYLGKLPIDVTIYIEASDQKY